MLQSPFVLFSGLYLLLGPLLGGKSNRGMCMGVTAKIYGIEATGR